MCGIAGGLSLPMNEAIRDRLLDTMARRGPDGRGWYQDPGCWLLHSRLAIIDPAGGCQPMELWWQREHYALVYNGELYNTAELRRELEGLGHSFQGHSDTEALLHAYAQWGPECLEKLNGIFGFGVWEERQQRLFLARDRMGVKPLFYLEHGGGLLFASEVKTLLAYPGVRARLDEQGAAQLLLLGPGRLPGSGVLQGVRELEPGTCALVQGGRGEIRRYWQLKDREHRDSFQETAARVRWLVTDAITRQTVSDVPIGCFLSGGLDSSIITAICANQAARRGQTLKTFSVDYQDNHRYFAPGKFQPSADSPYIEIMRQAFSTDHQTTVLTPEALDGALEDATRARDLPGMADVDFSLLAFCRDIRQAVKVALSGECADEIFGGYPWYRDPEVRDREGFPWAQNTAQRVTLLSPALRGRIRGEEFVMDAYRDTCAQADILPGASARERRLKEMVNLNHRWFMQTLLDRKDRMSMYSGLEVRVPFCDHRIAEYLYGVPWEYKDYAGTEKGLLRHALGDILPRQVAWRKKSPYPKTCHPRYQTLMEGRVNAILDDPGRPIFALVDREKLKALLAGELTWPWYGQLMRRPQLLAYIAQLDCWLEMYQVEFAF